MANYIELNPYAEIDAAVNQFITDKWAAIKTLTLRENPLKLGRIREVAYTKEILNAEGMIVGYINCHLLNDKYAQTNFHTDMNKRRHPEDNTAGQLVNTGFFKEHVIDETNRITMRLTFKQYQTKAIGLSDVTLSTVFKFNDKPTEIESAIRQKVATSLLWKDPGYVIATKKFFAEVQATLTAWTPTIEDVTIQTLCQVSE
mgnify:FL=1